MQELCTPRVCAFSDSRQQQIRFAGRGREGMPVHHWAVEVLLADAIGVWVAEMPIRRVGAHLECSRKEHRDGQDGEAGRVNPVPSATIARFMAVYDELCPTVDDKVRVEVFAERLGRPLSSVLTVAEWCRDRYLIDTYAGMREPIQIIEGRYRR